MPRFVHMDCETTGLHAGRTAWDVALIVHDCEDTDYRKLRSGVERHQFFVHPADLDWLTADPRALEIGGFWERHPHASQLLKMLEKLAEIEDDDTDPEAKRQLLQSMPYVLDGYLGLRTLRPRIGVARLADVAESVHRRTMNRSFVCGSNPPFDMDTMAPAIEAIGLKPEWHHHPVDVPSMCEGYLFGLGAQYAYPIQRKSEALAEAVGVDLTHYERHTAMGDCELFYAAWLNIIGA